MGWTDPLVGAVPGINCLRSLAWGYGYWFIAVAPQTLP
jgi:hypothetical protein